MLKSSLKNINNEHFSHISSQARKANEDLIELQSRINRNVHDIEARGILYDLKAKATFLAEAERQFYSHKAKVDHLNLTDRNSKFFQALVKEKSKA